MAVEFMHKDGVEVNKSRFYIRTVNSLNNKFMILKLNLMEFLNNKLPLKSEY